MSLPCAEPCFLAGNAEEFLEISRSKHPAYTKVKDFVVCDLVRKLCQGGIDSDGLTALSGLTALNLFTLISGKSCLQKSRNVTVLINRSNSYCDFLSTSFALPFHFKPLTPPRELKQLARSLEKTCTVFR